MRRLLLRCWLLLVLVTLSACGPYSGTPGDPPKPELRDQTIRQTMSYLHTKDAAGLKTMFAGNFKDLDQAVDDWIRMWGGVDAADYQVSYKSPGGPANYDTTIQAKLADGSPVTIPIWLTWSNDRWNIGYFSHPLSPTATPRK
ncbi:hypothetical protein [Arthrobacter sp. FW306-04-A]|uniref:hypothetical protein n=1 Tax=Arthrobacter sp. FW306-04-A TaxID=2879619 RepID=UPI0037BFF4B2|nr:hypothetical protein LFT43_04910 [Arthrobacter sp. FW306-04-A]